MICSNCATNCVDTAKFCGECGTALARVCGNCGNALGSKERFCPQCGTKATGLPFDDPPQPTAQIPISGEAERRQLTVMFCDLVGSTQLAVGLDPEDMRSILAAFRTVTSQIVGKYGSTVIQNYGDGALVMFGYPIAHENATESAILAGLEIVGAFASKVPALAKFDVTLAVRIGINTGQAVVGGDGAGEAGEELSVIGDVPNLAARLQGLAEPGQIVVSKATYNLTSDEFKFSDIGRHDLKGFSDPVQCYRVESSILKSATFASTETGRKTPLISREAELILLQQRWSAAAGSDGQVMLLSGEAGVGKSRLLQSFNQGLATSDIHLVRFFCSSFHSNSILNPILNDMRMRLGKNDETSDATKYAVLAGRVDKKLHQHLPALARLLNIEPPEGDTLKEATPEIIKQKTIAAVVNYYAAMADEKPLLMEFEDVHWCDPSTMEVISHFIDRLENQRWFLLLAFRPDYTPPLPQQSYITKLALNRFSKKDIGALIAQFAGGRELPQVLAEQIIDRADGIPLFAEEITRMVLESGWLREVDGRLQLADSYVSLTVPDSLQGSLMARLDRFPNAKVIAQVAATIGRRFSLDLLSLVSGHSAAQLQPLINQLIEAELVNKHGIAPNIIYDFKHALVQDAAYHSLLRTSRLKIHLRIAKALQQHFPEISNVEPEILGHHFSAGGAPVEAIPYHLTAGRRALAVSASLEAISHLENALSELGQFPADHKRDKQEFDILVMLAVPQASALGYSHEKVSQTYDRAMELAKDLRDHSAIFPVTYGLLRFHMLAARYTQAHEYALSLTDLGTKAGNRIMIAASHRSVGAIEFYRGNPKQTRAELSHVMNAKLSTEERRQALKYDVVDLDIASLSYGSWAEWQFGEADAACKMSAQARAIAKEIQHPFSTSFALCFSSWTHAFCDDYEKTLALSEEALDLAQHYTFQFWIGWAEVMAAWSRSKMSGDFEGGAVQVSRGILDWKATRSRLGLSYFLFLQADLNFESGDHKAALALLDEADEFVCKTDEFFWRPELYRLRGEVIIAKAANRKEAAIGTALLKDAKRQSDKMGAVALSSRATSSLQRRASISDLN